MNHRQWGIIQNDSEIMRGATSHSLSNCTYFEKSYAISANFFFIISNLFFFLIFSQIEKKPSLKYIKFKMVAYTQIVQQNYSFIV